ncbi:hypothetical protein [Streptomyces sp. LN245]|uniref:hypothetical protein n=1 Tax=Streptomyces sp. LN245 TaxID=3112975 RepID=UPI00371DEC47
MPGEDTGVGPGVRRPDEAHRESRWLDAGTHRIPLRIYRPGAQAYGWLVWAHGGSWQAGSVEHWHEPVMDLARASGCTVAVGGDSAGGTIAACAALARASGHSS